jgi:NAD(P)-dependent dehydrogenase (short-subunit alcohol dehydrogenase family)
MQTLQGKVAVITGGASGIGRATANAMARRGARIVVADLDAQSAKEVVAEVASNGGEAIAVHCDVSDANAFNALKACALDRFGAVDLVMNNVGVLTRGRPDHLPIEEWHRIIDTNLMSIVRSNLVFVPHFIEQGSGHIVNTASLAGLFTYSYDRLPYAACKAAIVQISEGLNLFLKPQGIGVTLLCPGPVLTNIVLSLPPSFGPEVPLRGPGAGFALLTADTVGEQVAQAVLSDTFIVYTHENTRDILVDRASDWNAFMARKVAELSQ